MSSLLRTQHGKEDHLCQTSLKINVDPPIIIQPLEAPSQVRHRVLLVPPPAQTVLSAAVQG